jgi:WD40 repeat protein
MSLDLKCLEWLNLNRSARTVLKSKKAKEQAAKNQQQPPIANYLFQIVGSVRNERLACLSADKVVNIYDQTNLRIVNKINNYATETLNAQQRAKPTLNEIGFFKQDPNMVFGCSDQGKFECWDLRTNTYNHDGENSVKPTIFFNDLSVSKREFLSADVNADDSLVAVGTNKGIDDALVYLFDIRVTNKYLFKFSESHSNDLSQVRFDPFRRSKFCSASLDGLVCLYDLEMKPEPVEAATGSSTEESDDEDDDDDDGNSSANDTHEEDPDLMEQVLTADSSVQKIGYLSSDPLSGVADQLYAITYTNDMFVWDLTTYDTVFKQQSKNKNIVSGALVDENDDTEEDYFFGCFHFGGSQVRQKSKLTICMGDKNGCVKLYQNESLVFETDKSEATGSSETRYHRDIIRSSYWNGRNLFTAGEDGFLYKWEVSKKSAVRVAAEQQSVNEQVDERVGSNRSGQKHGNQRSDLDDEAQHKKRKDNSSSFTSKSKNFYAKQKFQSNKKY